MGRLMGFVVLIIGLVIIYLGSLGLGLYGFENYALPTGIVIAILGLGMTIFSVPQNRRPPY